MENKTKYLGHDFQWALIYLKWSPPSNNRLPSNNNRPLFVWKKKQTPLAIIHGNMVIRFFFLLRLYSTGITLLRQYEDISPPVPHLFQTSALVMGSVFHFLGICIHNRSSPRKWRGWRCWCCLLWDARKREYGKIFDFLEFHAGNVSWTLWL